MTRTFELSELIRSDNFIDGTWTPAQDNVRFAVTNPATGEIIAEVADSSPADARAATDAAARALPAWRARLPKERAAVLHRWHALIMANLDALGALISLEQGKPLAEGKGEVAYGASYVAWFAEEATRIYGDLIPQQQRGKRMTAVKEPIGIVAAITPWNFPLAMIARKIAPALAAGCTVVAKPAEDTPLTAAALVLLAHEAGLPPGVLNLIVASRDHAVAVRRRAGCTTRACARSPSPALRRSANILRGIGGDAQEIVAGIGRQCALHRIRRCRPRRRRRRPDGCQIPQRRADLRVPEPRVCASRRLRALRRRCWPSASPR